MGQAGSQPSGAVPPRSRRAHTLPHEPARHAPKVLPVLAESPRLRSTDNGAILHAGGTISGRRETPAPRHHVHANGFRSRSAGGAGDASEVRTRERDPLHRSYTNLDLRGNDGMKRFGSEPDLRIEEEVQKPRCNNTKHFRKKYRAPPPPTANDHRHEHSSQESNEGNLRAEPQRKLRLFKTRNETKKLNGHAHSKIPTYKSTYTDYKNLDDDDQSFERRYRSPCKDKDQPRSKYPDTNDMIQSTASLKREERLIQAKQDYKISRIDRVSGCRAKTSKANEPIESWKTPLLSRNFRHSERFRREDNEPPLRREKTFDNTLLASEKENESPKATHESRMKAIGEQLKGSKLSPLAATSKPLRKSLPSLLTKNSEEKDEFQAELKKATSRIRNEIGNKIRNSKPSQNDKPMQKPNPTKSANQKVNESSLKPVNSAQVTNTRRPLTRLNDTKLPSYNKSSSNVKALESNKLKVNSKEKYMPDRGQASGKESTPEHSPTRKAEVTTYKKDTPQVAAPQERQKAIPSKHFYFGMIENNKAETQDHLKDFPGLGSPIIEEISNFHLIEKKLFGYHEEDEFDKFNAKLKEDCKIKNISSESALSSSGSDSSDENIALRLRPTLPKKTPTVPRFSPATAWKQLATLDAHLTNETVPLAVETKMSGEVSAESPRSEQSGDKSGDSGISGDHNVSDHRLDSPNRHHPTVPTWTPQQDLGDSSSDGGGGRLARAAPVATYAPAQQPFCLSLPRDDRGKQLQHGFNSLQKLKKSVSGAFGAALGSRRFDIEHEPILKEPEQNWFLTKSAPNSLSNPLLFQSPLRTKAGLEEDIKEESAPPSEKEAAAAWPTSSSYLSWGGHVMYLPPAPDQPLSLLATVDRPVRSKSSGCLEAAARAARAALANEMRERERSASPVARALPARVQPVTARAPNKGKRFTFQSTVRQLERRRLAERLSREADLKEQQRRSELEAMRRVEEEFQRKRAREKASIRQQLRLVSSGASSMPNDQTITKSRDSPDGSCRASPAPERPRDRRSNASSDLSSRSKSTTPVGSTELGSRRARQYRDWAPAHAHPPVSARMPPANNAYVGGEAGGFSGSPCSDNYRREFARGRSPRTPRAPRLLPAREPSTSGSEVSIRQPIRIREATKIKESPEESEEPIIVPTLRPSGPGRASITIR